MFSQEQGHDASFSDLSGSSNVVTIVIWAKAAIFMQWFAAGASISSAESVKGHKKLDTVDDFPGICVGLALRTIAKSTVNHLPVHCDIGHKALCPIIITPTKSGHTMTNARGHTRVVYTM